MSSHAHGEYIFGKNRQREMQMRLFLTIASLISSLSLIIGLLASVNAGLFRSSFIKKINLAPSGIVKNAFSENFLNNILVKNLFNVDLDSTLFITNHYITVSGK